MDHNKPKPKRVTWTFQPEEDVISLVSKAITHKAGRGAQGIRSSVLNGFLRAALAEFAGKRERGAQ